MNNLQWTLMLILTLILYYKYETDKDRYKKQIFHHIFVNMVITNIFTYGLLNYHIFKSSEIINISNFENTIMGKCILSLYGMLIYYILIIPYIT